MDNKSFRIIGRLQLYIRPGQAALTGNPLVVCKGRRDRSLNIHSLTPSRLGLVNRFFIINSRFVYLGLSIISIFSIVNIQYLNFIYFRDLNKPIISILSTMYRR